MKKKILSLILVLAVMLALPIAAYAEDHTGEASDGWYVEINKDKNMVSNFTSSMIADEISNMQPGDEVTFKVILRNTSGKEVDWYMLNEILDSLEDTQEKAEGGAYSYLLTYLDSSGKTITFYDSDTVGGEQKTPNSEIEGLNQVDSNLKNYMWLETMQSGRNGLVTLTVKLDGESQGNGYQTSRADLRMRFAVEFRPDKKIVKTGDDSFQLSPYYIGMGVSGILFLALAAESLRLKKKSKGGESK